MTFSIVGFCEETKMSGVAITTSSICVGSRCPWVRANVGAVATQNITDPSIGNEILDELEKGSSSQNALDKVITNRKYIEFRQVAVVDMNGHTASYTGKNILGKNSVSEGKHCIAAGNLLQSEKLPDEMVQSFQSSTGNHLAERLMQALQSGIDVGGEVGPTHSSALLIADKQKWPLIDLRVDWEDNCPVKKLKSLWVDYKPQMESYLLRALNPSKAPSYGVPGDQ